jgi:hypothetical protein
MINCPSLACFKHQFTLVQVSQSGLNGHPLVGELTSLPRGFAFDVVLQSALSLLLVSWQLLREEPSARSRYGGPLRHRW